jgi:hypothetical protein
MMRIDEKVPSIKGIVDIKLIDKDGNVKAHYTDHNLVVDSGIALILDTLVNNTAHQPTHIALGTGTNAAAAGDVSLQTEEYRKAITSSTITGNSAKFAAFIAFADYSGTISELGLFADATDTVGSGTLFSRFIPTTPITKTSADALVISWTITLSAS